MSVTGAHSVQAVLRVRISADEALLPPDMVHGGSGCHLYHHHHHGGSCALRQEQKLQVQTSVYTFVLLMSISAVLFFQF